MIEYRQNKNHSDMESFSCQSGGERVSGARLVKSVFFVRHEMDLHTSNRHFKLNIDRGRNFLQHFINNTFIGLLLTLLVLYIGVLGYHHLEHLDWVDSFLNAAMILGGMGPVNTLYTDAGKIFAGCYALFSGLAFIAIMAIILAPAVHHLIKRIHLEDKTDD